MFGSANSELAASATKAGGFGFIGGGLDFSPPTPHISTLRRELTNAQKLLDIHSGDILPIGIGFLMFRPEDFLQAVLPVIQEYRPQAVWLFAVKDGGRYAEFIPSLKQEGISWGMKVFVQIGSVEAAREALEDGADVLVVQGTDAGGHQFARGAGLMTLLPEVSDMAKKAASLSNIVILAAGGIMDGRGIVAAKALGAHGVVMGTRFVATTECPAPANVKAAMISATDGSQTTIKHTVHDDIQGTGFWPTYMDGRAIIGDSYKDFISGLSTDENVARYKKAVEDGDASRKILWAGAGVGLIESVLSAGEVIKNSQAEAKIIIEEMNSS